MSNFEELGAIFKNRAVQKKAPAHEWQDLALRVIRELGIPNNKRSSVFLVCKKFPPEFIRSCLIDTIELCQTGNRWQYFFKVVNAPPRERFRDDSPLERGGA